MDLGELYGSIGLDTSPLDKSLASAKSSLVKWGDDMKKQSDKDGEESGKRYAKGWQVGAIAIGAGIGVAVAGVISGAVAKGLNLEPALDKMAASLGLTTEQADRASKAAGKAYSNNWGESMEDAANATGIVISSIKGMRDASEDDLADMTSRVLALSDTFEVDVARASQVAGQMIKNGMAKDGKEALDLLAASFQKVPAAVREDVLDAVDEYGPFFKNMGIGGEQAMNLLTKAAEKGMYGIDKTGDAVKEFTIRATDMSAASGAAYKALGLEQGKMTKALLKGGDEGAAAFNKIVNGLVGMKDPVKQSQAALALFGTPLEDLSTKDIPKFLKGLTNTKDVLGDTAGTMDGVMTTASDNAAANLETFRRSLETGLVQTLGGQVIPFLNEGAKKLGEFGGWVQKNQQWLIPLTIGIAAFGAALVALGLAGYISTLGGLGAAFTLLAGKIGLTTIATNLKAGAELAAAGVSKALAAAQWLINAAMSANPIGLVVLALAALVAALVFAYQNSEEFRNIVNAAFGKVQEVAQAVVDWFTGPFAKFWVDLWETCARNVTGFFEAVQRIWNNLTSFVGDKVTGMGKGIQTGFNSAKDWAIGALNGLSNGAKRVWDGLNSYQQRWNSAFGKLLKGDFGGFAKDVQGIWSDMTKGLTKVWDGFQKGVAAIWDKLPADIKAPIRSAVGWINDTFIGGINGMLSKLNIGWRIPQIPGFAEGGYTGNGPKYRAAGIVHAGEVVWSQEDVDAWGGPQRVDAMRKERGGEGFAGGGIVPNARQGFRGYNPAFLASIKAWAAASGRTWYMTGNGGARSFADQLRAWNLYKAGKGPLAANPYKGGPHMIPGRAMDLNPRPGNYPAAKALLGRFGLGLTVGGEPWHVGWLRGRGGGGGGAAGMGDFGVKALIKGLLDKMPSLHPWSDIAGKALGQVPKGVINGILKAFGSPGYAMGTDYATAGMHPVAESGPELVVGPSTRQFRGGEKVYGPNATAKLLGEGVTPEAIRAALDGLRVDLDNGRLFFDGNLARHNAELSLKSHLIGVS